MSDEQLNATEIINALNSVTQIVIKTINSLQGSAKRNSIAHFSGLICNIVVLYCCALQLHDNSHGYVQSVLKHDSTLSAHKDCVTMCTFSASWLDSNTAPGGQEKNFAARWLFL